jgi:phospholipid/cholesterol/gamma-HCH transport system ATP-binding protein
MIRVEGVTKRFGERLVLDCVDLVVPDAAAVVILGPSGIGKTVLLRTMAGLLAPDAGRVLYDGHRLRWGLFADNHLNTGGIGYVFQGGALFDSMTVRENIALPLEEAPHARRAQVDSRVRAVLSLVGMEQASGLHPRELSGGMARLVAIARAVATDPRYVFFDEPTTGLDPAVRERVVELMRRLRDSDRKTLVVVTHDLDAARRLADRLYLLRAGRLVAADDVRKEDYEPACA